MDGRRPPAAAEPSRLPPTLLCSDRDLIGFCVGVCSIVFWMFAQIPQLYKNYQNKSSEALSAWFLAEVRHEVLGHVLDLCWTCRVQMGFPPRHPFCPRRLDGFPQGWFVQPAAKPHPPDSVAHWHSLLRSPLPCTPCCCCSGWVGTHSTWSARS